jgi:hypothetical protein
MDRHRRGRNIKKLWALVLLGIAYGGLLCFQDNLTDANNIEGIIGVLLGLYICSLPAAHAVDMLFFRRGGRGPFSSKRSAVMWVALNTLALLIGWAVIFIGTTRLVGRGG